MRIGILTLPFNNNYGGYLQAYALMRKLKDMGHQPILLNRRHNCNLLRHKLGYIHQCINHILTLKCPQRYESPEYWHKKRGAKMLSFVTKYISPITRPLYSSKALYREVKSQSLEVVIFGSDQLWRPEYGPEVQDYFLTGISGQNLKKISYAASFGNSTPIYSELDRLCCGKALSDFYAVSVRERSGLTVLEQLSWTNTIEPRVVLDPTLLLSSFEYNVILPQKKSLTKGKIFSYVLDSNGDIRDAINGMAVSLNKEIYEIMDIQCGYSVLPSIEDWLTGIRDADYIITDSFHGCVFSVIFNKPFVILVNKKRGIERFHDFLIEIGLEDRLTESLPLIYDKMCAPICWKIVNQKIEEKKKESIAFLKNCL